MSVIGVPLEGDQLVLTKGRDFKWSFENVDEHDEPLDFADGDLYFEFATSPVIKWHFVIDGSVASLKIESEEADLVPARTKWQLVFLPTGEPAGGDPIAIGSLKRQGA